MAMVDPCSTSPSDGTRQWARARLSATPRVGSAGTVDVLAVTMRPSTQPTRSVNVPPMSTPTMFKRTLRRTSESDGNELVGIELLRVRDAVEDAELVERMADDVERRHAPGAVVGEARDLRVVHFHHHARLDLDRLAGDANGGVLVGFHEADGLEPAAQEPLHHVAAFFDGIVGGEDDVRIEILGDVAEQ